MSLRFRQLERGVRRRLRQYDARREMGLAQRFVHWAESSPSVGPRYVRWLGTVVAISIVAPNFGTSITPQALLSLISIWAMFAATLRATLLQSIALHEPDYLSLWLFPLPASSIFNRMARRYALGSVWLFVEFAFAYWLICSSFADPYSSAVIAFGCAGLQIILSHAVTLLILSASANIRTQWFTVPAFVLGFCLLQFAFDNRWTDALALTLLNPFAWPNAICFSYVNSGAIALIPAALILVVFATIPFTLRRVRKLHGEGVYRKTPVMVRGRLVIPPERRAPEPATAENAIQLIRGAPNLRPLDWNAYGFIERVIGLALKPREKVSAEILINESISWSKNFRAIVWRLALFILIGGLLDLETVTQIARPFSSDPRAPIFAFMGVLFLEAFLFVWMLLIATRLFFWFAWPEHSFVANGVIRRNYRNFRLWPTNHWDTLVIVAKVNFIIVLTLLPMGIIFGLTTPWLRLQDLLAVTFPSAPALLVLPWAASFLAPASYLYPALEEGWRTWPRWLLNEGIRLTLFLILGPLVLATGLASVAVAIAFATASAGWFWWIGKSYRRGN